MRKAAKINYISLSLTRGLYDDEYQIVEKLFYIVANWSSLLQICTVTQIRLYYFGPTQKTPAEDFNYSLDNYFYSFLL